MHPLQRHFSISSLKRNIERHTFQLSLIWYRVPYRYVLYRYAFFIRDFQKKLGKKNKFIDLWRIEILFCIPPTTILDLRYHIYLSNSRPNYDSQLHTTLQISIKTEIFYFQLIFTPIVRIFLNSNQNLIDIFSHISVDANKFETPCE